MQDRVTFETTNACWILNKNSKNRKNKMYNHAHKLALMSRKQWMQVYVEDVKKQYGDSFKQYPTEYFKH